MSKKGDVKPDGAIEEGSLALALAFACAIQLAMSGLFNIMLGLEDPFARRGGRGQLDSIHVAMLVEVSRRQLLALEAAAATGTPATTRHVAATI